MDQRNQDVRPLDGYPNGITFHQCPRCGRDHRINVALEWKESALAMTLSPLPESGCEFWEYINRKGPTRLQIDLSVDKEQRLVQPDPQPDPVP